VRDNLRYHDEMYCAAGKVSSTGARNGETDADNDSKIILFRLPGSSYPLEKIILALQFEDYIRQDDKVRSSSMNLDALLAGGYSSLHIRRGDLQFKEVKFDSNQW
jgi:hypothetical protein